jgi:CheY-like chemotaxis protein
LNNNLFYIRDKRLKQEPEENLPQPETISILVVDDDPAVLQFFKAMLERETGYVVDTITSGKEALSLLDQRHFDVIMSDFSMPDIDGIALLREVRARGCKSLFVIITGKRLAHIAMDALNSGANYYLQKGADTARQFPRLIEFINTNVPRSSAEQEMTAWEQFYQSVVESMPDLVCRVQPDGLFTFANESGLRFFQKSYDDLLLQDFFSLIPRDERGEVLARLSHLSAVQPKILLEHHICNGAGTETLLQWSYFGFFSEQGELLEYQVCGREAAGLIRIRSPAPAPAPLPAPHRPLHPAPPLSRAPAEAAEEADSADDYDWQELVDTLQFLENPVFAIDRSGTVIAWNRAVEMLTGIESSRMVGRGAREYAVPFHGKATPMLIDHIFLPPGSPALAGLPKTRKIGNTYISEMEQVTIQGKPMLLWEKASPVYDGRGALIAAMEVLTAAEPEPGVESNGLEKYLGGISGITLKASGKGVGGAIAGAIGSSTGGYGVYATDLRIFVIRNPELDAGRMPVDSSQKPIHELEKLKVFEAWKRDLAGINMKKPGLLSGYLALLLENGTSFRVTIDNKKSFVHIEALMLLFAPEKVRNE